MKQIATSEYERRFSDVELMSREEVLAYVALVQVGPLKGPARQLESALGLGIAYGVLTTIGLAVIVMPLWLSMVGFPMAPPFLNVAFPGTVVSLVDHIVYAIPVALAYALVTSE